MSIVSGFNHQTPGDNQKPMIYHDGDDTYVLNKTADANGHPRYYGTGQFGRPVAYEAGSLVTEVPAKVIVIGYYDQNGQSLESITITNTSSHEINLATDRVNVSFTASGFFTCHVGILQKYYEGKVSGPEYGLVAFDVVDENLVTVTFRCPDVIPPKATIDCVFIDEYHYNISILHV